MFYISKFRRVNNSVTRDESCRILSALDSSHHKVYATASEVCKNPFKNTKFMLIRGRPMIQNPIYNYSIYRAYKKVKNMVEIIHHNEMFQLGAGFNLIPFLDNIENKKFIIGPIEVPHRIFAEDIGIPPTLLNIRKLLHPIFKKMFEKTISDANTIIVPDTEVEKQLVDYNTVKINFGVDLDNYVENDYDMDNRSIFYAGSAIKRKGVEYLLHAVSMIDDVTLHLRTAGHLVGAYKQICHDLKISDRVIFHEKELDLKDYLELMSSCRVTCLPTLSEGYSWTILDAMCMGVPVVTTTECHCSDLFHNGSIGIRTTPFNSIELSDALVKMLDNDAECRKSSRNGLRKRKYYDYKKIIPQYVDVYNDL